MISALKRATSAGLCRGEEGGRGRGADETSSTLDKLLPFFLC